ERDTDEQPVATCAALVEVDQDRDRSRGRDPGDEPAQPQAAVERADGQEALAQEAGQPREQVAPESRFCQAAFALRRRFRCFSHHCAPHSLNSIPQRRTRSTKSGSFPPGRASISRRTFRYSSCPFLRPSSRRRASSRGSASAKKSRRSDSSRYSIVTVDPKSQSLSASRPAFVRR